MKKSRLLIALLVMLVAASGYAQDSYRQALKDYWALYDKDYENQMDSVFKSTNTMLFKSGDLNLDQLTERYFEERFLDYMVDFIMPKMEEIGVSEAALREHVALCSTPAGKTYNEHLQQWAKVMEGELDSTMNQDSLKIKTEGAPNPVQLKAGIDAGYVEKYKKVMGANMVKVTQDYLDQFSTLAEMILEKVPNELTDAQNKLDEMKAWMPANLPTIATNCAYGIITEDDLDFASKLNALDTHKMLGLLPISKVDLMSMGYGMMGDYIEWMQDHGAVMEEHVKGLLNLMLGGNAGN